MTLRLHTIICSTRPSRIGPSVADWFQGFARADGQFDAHLVDLKDFDLPVFDEPKHPRLGDYQNEHTRRWSESVAKADAFVFVAPEYNYGPTPALVNAVTFLSKEWAYKPAAFVSYGGISGGIRGVQATKLLLTTLKVMPIPEAVVIPMVATMIGEDKVFRPNALMEQGADALLKELQRFAGALKPLRAT